MRQLPQSIEAEQALLGTLLVYPESTNTIIEYGLKASDFFKREHQRIFEHMLYFIEGNKTLDITTLVTRLNDHRLLSDAGGMEYLMFLGENSATPASLNYYVDIVLQKSQLRHLIEASQRIAEQGFDTTIEFEELLATAEKSIQTIAQNQRTEDMQKGSDVVDSVYQQIKDISTRGSKITGVHTGYSHLNNITNGLQKGDLIILAARPSVGKTAFALNLAMNAAQMNKDGKAGVAVFSLEMPASHLIMRMLSAQSQVPGNTLRNGRLSTEEWIRLNEAVGIMKTRNIFIDDSSSVKVAEIYAKCRKLKNEGQLDLIIIDYIQLISGRTNTDNRQQEVSEISRGLKQLARDLEVPVIALSQLSRLVERRDGNIPQLSDLRESGSIEQDADIVMFLYRKAYHNQEEKDVERDVEDSQLLIRKHRNGGLGDIDLVFSPKINRFHTAAQQGGSHEL